ncbi:MAG: DNA-directed DNA polymerase II small subunit [Halanaeroarchaeum sp.]
MPRPSHVRVVERLTDNGYNAEREAVTVLANAPDPIAAVDAVLDAATEDALTITVADARAALSTLEGKEAAAESTTVTGADSATSTAADATDRPGSTRSDGPASTSGSSGREDETIETQSSGYAGEMKGIEGGRRDPDDRPPVAIENDVTGESTGTGTYEDFVTVFRDRYERLSRQLRGRVNHRPTDALESMAGGSEAGVVGMIDDVRSTANGHWLIDLEDTNGTFPVLVMEDREFAAEVPALLEDEVIGVEGTLADDGGILFVDALHFPDVPRTHTPSTADRPVEAALISDVHVGSQEFLAEEWSAFADWLHTEEASSVEYLLVAGDMVEGVGVYPDQDEELDVIDIYEQYERFAEHLKEVPGDLDIVMIPGNHDAVRLAEPQPGFDEELRDIMRAHDARITGNPSVVTVEGVSILMYHGVSIDELVAELPDDLASYDRPQDAMAQLLRKRHLAPPFGGHMRISPEESDYLVIDEVPDVFHTGHVHKLGVGEYHNVRTVNSGCWQAQTSFQKSVNIEPDTATAPILDLQTLDVTVRKFS